LEMKEMPGLSEKYPKMVSINYNDCIRCYCCHEVCPEDAITVKSAPFSKGLVKKEGPRRK
jgi:formate hydrogenlyase subunit 6/NADH:ubiquinone oxidoreductase subunit I